MGFGVVVTGAAAISKALFAINENPLQNHPSLDGFKSFGHKNFANKTAIFNPNHPSLDGFKSYGHKCAKNGTGAMNFSSRSKGGTTAGNTHVANKNAIFNPSKKSATDAKRVQSIQQLKL